MSIQTDNKIPVYPNNSMSIPVSIASKASKNNAYTRYSTAADLTNETSATLSKTDPDTNPPNSEIGAGSAELM